MGNIVKFENLEGRLIQYKNAFVLVDSDVAELYGTTTKEVNQAVSNNHNKFPNGYIIELTKDEKNELVKNFDRFNRLKHSTAIELNLGFVKVSRVVKVKKNNEEQN